MANQNALIQALEARFNPVKTPATDIVHEYLSLGAVENKLCSVEREISLLSRALEAARNEETRLQVAKRRLVNDRRPVHRVSDEIIAWIFDLSDPRDLDQTPTLARRISSVCYRWRAVTFHCPKLWRYFRLRYDHTLQKTITIDMFYVYLQRSQKCTLDLEIEIQESDDFDFKDGQIEYMLRLVGPYFARCESLRLVLGEESVVLQVLPLKYVVPALKHFTLRCLEPSQEFNEIDPIFSAPPPNLMRLHIEGYAGHLPAPAGINPLPVTHLFFHSVASVAITQLLPLCPALQVLQWHDDQYFDLVDPRSPIITFPSLILLDVRGENPETSLFNIVAPKLRHLLYTEHEDAGPPVSLPRFMSLPSVRSLGICPIDDSDNGAEFEWEKLISAHSQLEILMLDCAKLQNSRSLLAILWMLALCSTLDPTDGVNHAGTRSQAHFTPV